MTGIARTVAAEALFATRQQHVQPFHIMELGLPSGTVYLSEGPEIEFNSGSGTHTYVAGRIRVGTLDWTGEAAQSCSIELYNEDNTAAEWVLQNQLSEASITLWLLYQNANGTWTTPVKYVVGSCDRVDLTPDSLQLSVVTNNVSRVFFPNQYIGAAGFNHMPQEGAVVFWNSTTYVLEREYE